MNGLQIATTTKGARPIPTLRTDETATEAEPGSRRCNGAWPMKNCRHFSREDNAPLRIFTPRERFFAVSPPIPCLWYFETAPLIFCFSEDIVRFL